MLSYIEMILESFRGARSIDELQEALNRATRSLGFDQFAMGHHVDLRSLPAGVIRLSTYNEDWVSHVFERGYFADDPIHLERFSRFLN